MNQIIDVREYGYNNKISYLKMEQNKGTNKSLNRRRQKDIWSDQQIQLLFKLYEEFGPNWTQITSHFLNKQPHAAKNKIKMALLQTVNNLQRFLNRNKQQKFSKIKLSVVYSILECGFQVKQKLKATQQNTKNQSFLVKLRSQIIALSKKYTDFEDSQIMEIIKKMKKLNVDIRSYGLFKLKNRKGWKLNQNLFEKIKQLDQQQKQLSKFQQGEELRNTSLYPLSQQISTTSLVDRQELNIFQSESVLQSMRQISSNCKQFIPDTEEFMSLFF